MGNSNKKAGKKAPDVKVTACTVHDHILACIKEHGTRTAQVDADTGEEVTFATILERSSALQAALSARGLCDVDAAIVIGENSVHYPWVVLGVLRTGAAAHLIDPRCSVLELEHALAVSRPPIALVSGPVSQRKEIIDSLREFPDVRFILVWGTGGSNVAGDVGGDLPEGIAALEEVAASPARSAASMSSAAASDSKAGASDSNACSTPLFGTFPVPPHPTPSSTAASYGDSYSPLNPDPPVPLYLSKKFILEHAEEGLRVKEPGRSVALILQSSGSTGMPKGVMLAHDSILYAIKLGLNNMNAVRPILIQQGDVVAGISPYFHAYGGMIMLMSLCAGVKMVAMSRFSMEVLLSAIEQHKITVIHVVSSLLVSMSKLPLEQLNRLSALQRIWSGAAPISPLVQSALSNRLPNVRLSHCYGMTETTFTVFCGDVRADKPGSPGTLVRGMRCKIIDLESGKEDTTGARGELCFKGPMLMKGYLNNRKATREAFEDEGWLRSGDVGFKDEDGYFYVVDRIKDILKYNGNQVSPSELEALLMTHPSIKEAAVFGIPHEYGQAPRALVVLNDGFEVEEKELQSFIAGKVAPYKMLRGGVKFVTTPFPRTPSGKLKRKKIRELMIEMSDDLDELTLPGVKEDKTEDSPPPESPTVVPSAVSRVGVTTQMQTLLAKTLGFTSSAPEASKKSGEPSKDAKTSKDSESVPHSPVEAESRQLQSHRPSITSVTSIISTVGSSRSHASSVSSANRSVSSVIEASQVPLPLSEPTSPEDPNISRGSAPMDLTPGVIQESNQDSPSLS